MSLITLLVGCVLIGVGVSLSPLVGGLVAFALIGAVLGCHRMAGTR